MNQKLSEIIQDNAPFFYFDEIGQKTCKFFVKSKFLSYIRVTASFFRFHQNKKIWNINLYHLQQIFFHTIHSASNDFYFMVIIILNYDMCSFELDR